MPSLKRTVFWAPRLRPDRIEALYKSEAYGVLDENLLDEVFVDIYLRSESMDVVTNAARGGAVKCLHCGNLIAERSRRDGKDEQIQCPDFGWKTTWGAYLKTYQGKQLDAGGVYPAVKEFLREARQAKRPMQKMMLIDLLIHKFHDWSVNHDNPGRTGAANLIQGKTEEVLQFLTALSNYVPSDLEMRQRLNGWKRTAELTKAKMDRGKEEIAKKKERAKQTRARREKNKKLRAKYKKKPRA